MFFPFRARGAACLIAILFALTLALPATSARGEAPDGILRLHVIANSDSNEDQSVKLAVRDALLAFIDAQKSALDTERFILEHGAELLTIAENTLQKNGFSYGVQLLLGACDFPTRAYGNETYPAGTYNALRVILGRGVGQNWWCVLFPPLCIVTADREALPNADEIEFESTLVKWFRSLGARS